MSRGHEVSRLDPSPSGVVSSLSCGEVVFSAICRADEVWQPLMSWKDHLNRGPVQFCDLPLLPESFLSIGLAAGRTPHRR